MFERDRREPRLSDITGRGNVRSNKYFYLAFEGENEFNYFGIVKKYKAEMGIADNVDIIRLYRYEDESGETNPKWIMDKIIDLKRGLCGEYTVRHFVSLALENFIQAAKKDMPASLKNDEYEKKVERLVSTVHGAEQELLDKLENDSYSRDGIITEKHEAFSVVKDKLKSLFPEFKRPILLMRNPTSREHFTKEDLEKDDFCLVFDRDYQSDYFRLDAGETKDEYYRNLVSRFEGGNVKLFITNPCFEFWLALHFDDLTFDDDKMRVNPKEANGKRYSENVLRKHLGDYGKARLDESWFIGKKKNCAPIKKAIARIDENGYAKTLGDLEKKIGSSIVLLFEEMCKKPSDDDEYAED